MEKIVKYRIRNKHNMMKSNNKQSRKIKSASLSKLEKMHMELYMRAVTTGSR